MKNAWRILSVAWFAAGLVAVGSAGAAENVNIGVIYPLTGNAASAVQSAKDAVNLGAEIVNTAHPGT
jgi:branched-chain amino acid transport system substrate-binding protein